MVTLVFLVTITGIAKIKVCWVIMSDTILTLKYSIFEETNGLGLVRQSLTVFCCSTVYSNYSYSIIPTCESDCAALNTKFVLYIQYVQQ
jgi:hypothetical protein